MSEYCPMCNGFEAEIRRLNEQLSAATARASELERAARAVVTADTCPMPGKTRFEATSEAIAKLEALLPEPPAMCAANPDGKGETNG